jgi:hypothetical protein
MDWKGSILLISTFSLSKQILIDTCMPVVQGSVNQLINSAMIGKETNSTEQSPSWETNHNSSGNSLPFM